MDALFSHPWSETESGQKKNVNSHWKLVNFLVQIAVETNISGTTFACFEEGFIHFFKLSASTLWTRALDEIMILAIEYDGSWTLVSDSFIRHTWTTKVPLFGVRLDFGSFFFPSL